jgi:site-specific DNA-cytosine methylase
MGKHQKYISLFSGIGGLEPSSGAPLLFCELDGVSREVLARAYPHTRLHDDVKTLKGESADFVLGGWPCQDLSIAGQMAGLSGSKSGLFYELCRIVRESGAHTAILENVPGLFISKGGKDFLDVVKSLNEQGLTHIAWRTINSAELGLPQYRERIFIVASREKNHALSVHARKPDPDLSDFKCECPDVLGFYWTGGARSLCIRKNAIPALKVGAPSEKGGTSPIAVFYGTTVRKLTPEEAIKLQGFDQKLVEGIGYGDVLRIAGDAVSRPVGAFVVDSVFEASRNQTIELRPSEMGRIPEHGYWHAGMFWLVRHNRTFRHRHIWKFLDSDAKKELSPQAAAGLCCRIIRSGADVPSDLFEVLHEKSKTRTKLLGTKVNSFDILHNDLDAVGYLKRLKSKRSHTQSDFFGTID